jgi:hypothetical protein
MCDLSAWDDPQGGHRVSSKGLPTTVGIRRDSLSEGNLQFLPLKNTCPRGPSLCFLLHWLPRGASPPELRQHKLIPQGLAKISRSKQWFQRLGLAIGWKYWEYHEA